MTEISQKPPTTIADVLESGKIGTPIIETTSTSLVATPTHFENGDTQFGGTLVPHPSGKTPPAGPKILYTKDGVPTYVETLRCTTCDCYFTLTFTDITRRNRQCAGCHFKSNGKQGSSMVRGSVTTMPTVVIGPTKDKDEKKIGFQSSSSSTTDDKKSDSSKSGTGSNGYSGYGSYSGWRSGESYLGSGNYQGYRYRSDVDKFFDSLDKIAEAQGKEIEEISDPDLNNDDHWAKVVASATKKAKQIETKKKRKGKKSSSSSSKTTTHLTSRERRRERDRSKSSSSSTSEKKDDSDKDKKPEMKPKASTSYSVQRGGGYHWMD